MLPTLLEQPFKQLSSIIFLRCGSTASSSAHSSTNTHPLLESLGLPAVMLQPARSRGARREFIGGEDEEPRGFNPRSSRGARLLTVHGREPGLPVSIHAPARGATCRLTSPGSRSGRFNPRAREGRDSSSMHSHRIEPITLYRKSLSADFSTLITPIRRANPARTSLGNLQSLRFARDFRTETVYTSRRNYLCARR